MGTIKGEKILLNTYGNFLGVGKGCLILKDKDDNTKKYPLVESEIGEVVLTSGNTVSVGALSALAFWGITTLVTTRNGKPIAMLKNINYDSHVKTRLYQYDAVKNGKGFQIAKTLVQSKILGENLLLIKYGLKPEYETIDLVENLQSPSEYSVKRNSEFLQFRDRLLSIEGKQADYYFSQIFQLFPEELRPAKRIGYRAYDEINNCFNLCYRLLFFKCYSALIQSHLEPYLGFLHNEQFGRLSLVCDLQELYRHLVDDFLIGYCKNLKPRDFKAKTEMFNDKKGKRMYLNDTATNDMTKELHQYFQKKVMVPRKRKGIKQEIESMIGEEAQILAKFLRNEAQEWTPRIALPS